MIIARHNFLPPVALIKYKYWNIGWMKSYFHKTDWLLDLFWWSQKKFTFLKPITDHTDYPTSCTLCRPAIECFQLLNIIPALAEKNFQPTNALPPSYSWKCFPYVTSYKCQTSSQFVLHSDFRHIMKQASKTVLENVNCSSLWISEVKWC